MSIGALTELDVMLTMRPNPRASMPSMVAWINATGVSMLASSALIQASRSQSRKLPGGGPPALVTTMSKSRPGPSACEKTASRPASVVMSAATAKALTPYWLLSRAAASSSACAPRATITTWTPSAASAVAQPRPSPLLAPPTNAHLPFKPKSIAISFSD